MRQRDSLKECVVPVPRTRGTALVRVHFQRNIFEPRPIVRRCELKQTRETSEGILETLVTILDKRYATSAPIDAYPTSLSCTLPSQPERTVLASLRRYGQDAQYDKSQLAHCRSELSKILACRNGAFGSHEFECGACGQRRIIYAACNNRHCPGCGWLKRKAWLDTVVAWRLPSEYYHTVFTVPHKLNRLLMANQKECYQLFFHTAQATLLHTAKRDFNCQPGMILTLHTWGQRMLTHIHIHAIVTAGGMSIDTSTPTWIPIQPDAPGMENEALALEFQKRFVRGLKLLYKKGLLVMPEGTAGVAPITCQAEFDKRLDRIASKPWVANAKRTAQHFRNTIFLIRYAANYVVGIAISDNRILIDENGNVTIKYKCYKRKIRTTETMTGEEFVRRFMLHIVPNGVHRVRYGGIFHGKGRTERLNRCRDLLLEYNEKNNIQYDNAIEVSLSPAPLVPDLPPTLEQPQAPEPQASKSLTNVERNLPKCSRCKTPEMRSLGFQDASTTRAWIAISQQVIAMYAMAWTTFDDLSELLKKNIRVKLEINGIEQTWFEFDTRVREKVILGIPDSLSMIIINSHCAHLPSPSLPIPEW